MAADARASSALRLECLLLPEWQSNASFTFIYHSCLLARFSTPLTLLIENTNGRIIYMSSTMEQQKMKKKSHRHVAVLAFPFGSHPGSLFRLARVMAARAPDVTFSFLSSPSSISFLSQTHPGLTENLLLFHVDVGPPPADNIVSKWQQMEMFMKAAPGNLMAGIELAILGTGEVITCVVSDVYLWTAGDVAEEMGVPWVAVRTGYASAFVPYVYIDRLRQAYGVVNDDDDHGDVAEEMGVPWVAVRTGYASAFVPYVYIDRLRQAYGVVNDDDDHVVRYCWHPKADEPLGTVVPCLSDFRVGDLPGGILFHVDGPFPRLLHSMAKQLSRAAAVVFNTVQGLDPAIDAVFASTLKKYLPVGPLNLLLPSPIINEEEEEECIAWLDRQVPSSVAYVSFGTVSLLPQSELAELAHGLGASGAPFLWALRDKESSLPAGFLDRMKGKGLVLDWVPQARVLAHGAVGVFITHCGWNSVLEAVTCGLPMICRPMFGDQMMSARTILSVWRIGFGFSGGKVTSQELVTSLRKILINGTTAAATTTTGDQDYAGGGGEVRDEIRGRLHELKTRLLLAVAPGGSTQNNLNYLLEVVVKGGEIIE